MKKLLLSTLLLLGSAQLSALGDCGDFDVTVDYLVWKPAGVVQELGQVSRVVEGWNNVTRVTVDPTYQSGIRGELIWSPRCSPFAVVGRYYWVEPRHSQTFHGESDTISAQLETIYHAGDLLLSTQLCQWNCFQLELLAGGGFLYFAEVSKRQSLSELGEVHARFAGGGGSLGLAGVWCLGCSFEAFAEARFGLLFGSRMDAQVEVTQLGATFFTPASGQEWTRELDLRFGGRYARNCGRVNLGLELGWEARSYLDLFSALKSEGSGKAMGGPFIGLSGKF